MPYRRPADATARWARYYEAHRDAVLASQRQGRERANAWFRALCRVYDWRCHYCGKRKPLTKDHLIARVMGGSDDPSNIVPACKRCNSAKGARPVHEFKPGMACPCGKC